MTRFLSKKDVRALITLSATQIARLESEGKFPRRIRLGAGRYSRVVWIYEEVIAWMEAKVSARDKAADSCASRTRFL